MMCNRITVPQCLVYTNIGPILIEIAIVVILAVYGYSHSGYYWKNIHSRWANGRQRQYVVRDGCHDQTTVMKPFTFIFIVFAICCVQLWMNFGLFVIASSSSSDRVRFIYTICSNVICVVMMNIPWIVIGCDILVNLTGDCLEKVGGIIALYLILQTISVGWSLLNAILGLFIYKKMQQNIPNDGLGALGNREADHRRLLMSHEDETLTGHIGSGVINK